MNISESIKSKMQSFTHAIRYGNSTDKKIQMYREFIIGNVSGVLENTFPYFNIHASRELKDTILKVFFEDNISSEPAFHQIATGILKSSKSVEMSEKWSKLIEFEWLLFSIEIDESKVFKNIEITKNLSFRDIKSIQANPTLTFISLPFDINDLNEKISEDQNMLYAIYRDVNHRTSYHMLSPLEFAVLSSMLEKGVSIVDLYDFQQIDNKYKEQLIKSLVSWHNQNMISLSV
ncbi:MULTISPECIES: HvfC/BufC family peptide modification chaperone [unclassified Francisella]|uniref:HvfC/BufC family peptide modification chaperone n=1 Tax=unclassified Francisella TaxID=2610885 RepID=UPI002E37F3BB|nr:MULTISPECIES: putative DNA-binding domain-containing protein [unclassified Francisella]MED7818633.1 putative DNA-binding domain-containing protein [Francisella sp. 19S2-4]MED7829469.1 putative DNA-binding domain-containing protein [Francisella sp. 19S2-10]